MFFRLLSGLFGERIGRRAMRIISVILFLVALGLVAGAVSSTITDNNLRAHGVTTNATIVNVQTTRTYSHTSKTYTNSYTDLITFTTANGSRQQASIDNPDDRTVGDTLVVVYDPNHPSTVEEKSDLSHPWWLTLTIFLVLALGFGAAAIWLWRKASRLGRQQHAWDDGVQFGVDHL